MVNNEDDTTGFQPTELHESILEFLVESICGPTPPWYHDDRPITDQPKTNSNGKVIQLSNANKKVKI